MGWTLALSGRQEYERVKDELDKSHLTVLIAVRWLFFCYSTTMFLRVCTIKISKTIVYTRQKWLKLSCIHDKIKIYHRVYTIKCSSEVAK